MKIGATIFLSLLISAYTSTNFITPSTVDNQLTIDDNEAFVDWNFNHEYWDTLKHEFNPQPLPYYQAFYGGFPKKPDGEWLYGADNIYNPIGGEILQARIDYPERTKNTCALKVSIALNNSGIHIPSIDEETLSGKDGKYYFLNVKAMSIWMKSTFPNFEEYKHNIDYVDIDDVHNKIEGRRGIIIILYIHNKESEVSGHSDIYVGDTCSVSKNCSIAGNADILFWDLK